MQRSVRSQNCEGWRVWLKRWTIFQNDTKQKTKSCLPHSSFVFLISLRWRLMTFHLSSGLLRTGWSTGFPVTGPGCFSPTETRETRIDAYYKRKLSWWMSLEIYTYKKNECMIRWDSHMYILVCLFYPSYICSCLCVVFPFNQFWGGVNWKLSSIQRFLSSRRWNIDSKATGMFGVFGNSPQHCFGSCLLRNMIFSRQVGQVSCQLSLAPWGAPVAASSTPAMQFLKGFKSLARRSCWRAIFRWSRDSWSTESRNVWWRFRCSWQKINVNRGLSVEIVEFCYKARKWLW